MLIVCGSFFNKPCFKTSIIHTNNQDIKIYQQPPPIFIQILVKYKPNQGMGVACIFVFVWQVESI